MPRSTVHDINPRCFKTVGRKHTRRLSIVFSMTATPHQTNSYLAFEFI